MAFKIVVIGYSEMFAALIQACFESGNKVVGVMRHERVTNHPIKLLFKDLFCASKDFAYIRSLKLNEIKATSANSDKFRQEIRKLNADMIIVASWGEKLKKETIILPKVACINCHPAMLPKYRGPNPYLEVIRHMERETGVTFHLMDEDFDTGPILYSKTVQIFNTDNGQILRSRCALAAKEALKELLWQMQNDIVIPIGQANHLASYYPQITAKDVVIDFKKSSAAIDAQIRAISCWQKPYFVHKNNFFAVDKYEIKKNNTSKKSPGDIVAKNGQSISILCGDNRVIKFIKPKLYGWFRGLFSNLYIKFFVEVK